MKKMMISLIAATLASGTVFAAGQVISINPDAMQWHPSKDMPGAQVAMMVGDPRKSGPFVARVKLPANYQIPVHTHEINEYDTVITGALHVAMKNNNFKFFRARDVVAGGFILIPAKMSHHAWTNEETIVQINGMGPWGMMYDKDQRKA